MAIPRNRPTIKATLPAAIVAMLPACMAAFVVVIPAWTAACVACAPVIAAACVAWATSTARIAPASLPHGLRRRSGERRAPTAVPAHTVGTIDGVTWSEDESLGERYVAAIGVPGLTAEHARRHLEVERRLVAELRSSSPENRTATFRRCYDELFRNLPWLQRVEGCGDADRWVPLLGDEPLRVHEVGSGTGTLARRLARAGHVVEASDISGERGDWTDEHGVRWVETDGVHLDRFATRGPYDVVVSDQVV